MDAHNRHMADAAAEAAAEAAAIADMMADGLEIPGDDDASTDYGDDYYMTDWEEYASWYDEGFDLPEDYQF